MAELTTNKTQQQSDLDMLRAQFEFETVKLDSHYGFDKFIGLKLSEEVCRYHKIIPLEVIDNKYLKLAMANPFDMVAQQIASSKAELEIKAVQSSAEEIDSAINQMFSEEANFEETLQELVELDEEVAEDTTENLSDDILRSKATDAPAVVFVNSLLVQAVQERASDIHIEPQESSIRVRLRIDGVLKELPLANKRLQDGVVARIKILAGMDIAERRIPQDGRVKFKIMGRSVDIRVSSIPGIYGEKIVMRILDKGSTSLSLDDVGMEPDTLSRFKDIANAAHGMILVTGPTGSGKTTTLYSVLNYINSPRLNIMTVEDPVEYRLAGVNQIQTHSKVGLTFATSLRSFLRQDPDVIMVGEIRDLETGEIAVKAALTGHLVLSTLHTNDAVATIMRLLNMGIDKYLITSSLSVITAQRLVRRICLNCKQPYDPPKEIRLALQNRGVQLQGHQFFKGAGCNQCSGSGYWGRLALHEVMFMNGEIRNLVVHDQPESEIKKAAAQNGMISLAEDGVEKSARGITTLSEIIRVI